MITYPQFRWELERSLVHAQSFRTRAWKDYSRLLIARDYAGWSLDADAAALKSICTSQGIQCVSWHWASISRKQVMFLTDQFSLLNPVDWGSHRIGFAYFHGYPNSGLKEFDQVYENLKRTHDRISRIQVSHRAMRDVVLETGIEPTKVKLIPIGIDARHFTSASPRLRKKVRDSLNIPATSFVVGSFQKDGIGWGEGNEPKLIKGPDLFVQSMVRVKQRIP